MKKLTITFFFIGLLGTSCQKILMTYYGVKNPKIENISSISHYVNKKTDNNSNDYELIFFKDLEALNHFNNKFNLNVPDAYFFNKNGFFIDYKKEPNECNANVNNFIKDIKQMDTITPKNNLNIIQLNGLFVNRHKKNVKFKNNKTIIILSFAKYLGKVNDEHTFDWVKSINKLKLKGFDLEVYLADFDFMDFWDIKKEDLPKIK